MFVVAFRGEALMRSGTLSALGLIATALPAFAVGPASRIISVPLDARQLSLHNVNAENIEFRKRKALKLGLTPEAEAADIDATFAVLPAQPMNNFVVEADVAGMPTTEGTAARGFVGIAFRIAENRDSFEAIYLRPTNGRADDQVRRNRSIQYISHPDYPWHRLRAEAPGQFETYVDLDPGKWTHMKIEVNGKRASLFVDGSKQPNLIVSDLKLGEQAGRLGLWVGPGSIALFSNVRITPILHN
jgi:hypothetical protein